jgi:hypothetical protein
MIRIGLIDGPLSSDYPGLEAQKWFCDADGTSGADRHACAMAETIRSYAGPDLQILNAVVFPGRLVTSRQAVCDALEWLADTKPGIVLCSFGMANSSIELRIGITRLQDTGCLVVASAPARGDPVYPAAFERVVSVQGDARCNSGELSRLDLPQATFGACPIATGDPEIRGASAAAAHMAGMLAQHWQEEALLSAPTRLIRYRGRECRGPTVAERKTGAA